MRVNLDPAIRCQVGLAAGPPDPGPVARGRPLKALTLASVRNSHSNGPPWSRVPARFDKRYRRIELARDKVSRPVHWLSEASPLTR